MSFSRQCRLTERRDFLRCYDGGRRFFSRDFVLFVLRREDSSLQWRLGLAVTKKSGSAVWRNRTRRLVKEFFRLERAKVPAGHDYVVVPKRSMRPRDLDLEVVRMELGPLLLAVERKMAGPER